mmetsp:Transcript_2089/g.5571  ORF Transcript_2089/g.5571 Transcript_2089/m.5571 type:complete len:280 (+) Transcript_2089:1608-2447(+)
MRRAPPPARGRCGPPCAAWRKCSGSAARGPWGPPPSRARDRRRGRGARGAARAAAGQANALRGRTHRPRLAGGGAPPPASLGRWVLPRRALAWPAAARAAPRAPRPRRRSRAREGGGPQGPLAALPLHFLHAAQGGPHRPRAGGGALRIVVHGQLGVGSQLRPRLPRAGRPQQEPREPARVRSAMHVPLRHHLLHHLDELVRAPGHPAQQAVAGSRQPTARGRHDGVAGLHRMEVYGGDLLELNGARAGRRPRRHGQRQRSQRTDALAAKARRAPGAAR